MKHKLEIIKLRNEGKTYLEIAKELGCAKSTVSFHCSKLEGNSEKVEQLREIANQERKLNSKPIPQIGNTKPKCKGCKIEFDRTYNSQVYHSPECYKKYNGMDECPTCDGKKRVCSLTCFNCRKKDQFIVSLNTTLEEIYNRTSIKGKHPSWKNAHIRYYARRWNKDLIDEACKNCGYSKHVEICHIKALSTFPLTATIGEVNCKTNVVALCPNCHWELDKGLLNLK